MLNRKQNRRNLTTIIALTLTITIAGLTGCDSSTSIGPESKQSAPTAADKNDATGDTSKPAPPTPPITESFEAAPQLSLFPRAGDVRPEETEERFPYWKTFIEHIVKTSGPANIVREESKTSWALRGIKTIDSVGFFSPISVQPATSYQVTFQIKTELAEGASAGIGVLEFSDFLWIGNQFTEVQLNDYVTRSQEGVRLTGTRDWEEQSFTFKTSPQTGMIHLIFFREGEHDRKPVLFDDISITPL